MKIMRKGQWEKQPATSSRFYLYPSKIYDKTFGRKKKEAMKGGNVEQEQFKTGVNCEGTTNEALKEKTLSKNETKMEKGEIERREKQNEEKEEKGGKKNGYIKENRSGSESSSESESGSESEEESDDDEELNNSNNKNNNSNNKNNNNTNKNNNNNNNNNNSNNSKSSNNNNNNNKEKENKNDKVEDKMKEHKSSSKEMSLERNSENVEIHKIYENDEDVSRKNSACSEKNVEKKKKKGKILNKLKFPSYFHKSYDKVSNALMKTSKSILKTNNNGDIKNEKKESIQSNEGNNDTSLSYEEKGNEEDNEEEYLVDLTEEELNILKRYLNNKINIEESNEEIIKNFKTCLEENDSKKKVLILNELAQLLNERKLLIKSLNYFKHLNTVFNARVEKYEESYNVLKSENEQLNENTKILKNYIYNIQSSGNNDSPNSTEKEVIEEEEMISKEEVISKKEVIAKEDINA